MKRILSVLMLFFVFAVLTTCRNSSSDRAAGNDPLEGTITMSGAWALYPMAVKWAEEFQKLHTKVQIDIAAGGAGKGMADALAGMVDIGNISREIFPQEIEKGAWWVSVTKDAVVPTINAANPLIQGILASGLSAENARGIWITGECTEWNPLLSAPPDGHSEIHAYTRSDACGAAQTWAAYLGGTQEDLLGVGVYGDPGLAEAVKKDPLGIGYNNLNYAYDMKTEEQIEGIRVLPLDLNGNGLIDQEEFFYQNKQTLIQAIGSDKYPSPPARDLHFVCQGRPARKVVAEFVRWVLTDGQQYVNEAGYIRLSQEKLKEQLGKLDG